jgi:hypothetical protein
METVLMKIPEVMERLAVGQTKVYELMSSGELRSVKVDEYQRASGRPYPEVAGSNPAPATDVMSQDIAEGRTQ